MQRLAQAEAELAQSRQECIVLRAELEKYVTWVPPGHYASPIPALEEFAARRRELYAIRRTLPGIKLNEAGQIALFEALLPFYAEVPFPAAHSPEFRYWFENPAFSYSDAILLFCLLRLLRPRRLIEVGCGYSSAAVLDANELFFDNTISLTFVEPDTRVLRSLLKPGDDVRCEILEQPVQDVLLNRFRELAAGDFLLIDSSHIAKLGSDVNHLIFNVLPVLASGIYIHIHDIFYPFEYPLDRVYEGRAWNEAYLVRAFLQFNPQFEIRFFNTFFDWFHKPRYFTGMPLVQKNTGGGLWLKKL